MNVVMNARRLIEVRGTAEGHLAPQQLDALLGLAEQGTSELLAIQRAALADAD